MASPLRLAIFSAIIVLSIFLGFGYTVEFFMVVVYSLTAFYTLWGIVHLTIVISGSRTPGEIDCSKIPRGDLPKISIIIPARDEPILGRTIEACLLHTDYPMDKKEVIVVVDDAGGETIGLWFQQRYPRNVKVLARRRSYPTKPSALNDSIHLCTGDIIGIMDVEDIPDRDVFLKAAYAIKYEGRSAAQAILSISNGNDSWISKIFSMEYAGWFRLLLNGRSKIDLYTPLGGTGNYFKKSALQNIGLYDSTNLAEDAELSIRLLIAGWNVRVLDARHWEEAPVSFESWIKQRTRWYRGWLQSLWKYIPLLILSPTNVRRIGIGRTVSIVMMLIAPFVVVLTWLAYSITLMWGLEMGGLIDPMLSRIPGVQFVTSVPLIFNFLYYYFWIKGAKLEHISFRASRDLPRMIYYMNVMMPIAAIRALYQELFKPIKWEKTTHEGRGVMWNASMNK